MMAWLLVAFAILSSALQLTNCARGAGDVARNPQHDEAVNQVKLAIRQCLVELGSESASEEHRAAKPVVAKSGKMPSSYMAKLVTSIAARLHKGTRSIDDILTRAKQQQPISPASFVEFARFYAKYLVDDADIRIGDLAETASSSKMNLELQEIVRRLLEETWEKLHEIVLWRGLGARFMATADYSSSTAKQFDAVLNKFSDMVQGVAVLQGRKTLTEKQLDAVLDLSLVRNLATQIANSTTDANVKQRMEKTLISGNKMASLLTHLLFLQQIVALQKDKVAKEGRQQKRAAGTSLSSNSADVRRGKTQKKAASAFDETEWSENMTSYQYNKYFEMGLINALRSLIVSEEAENFVQILRENVEGKWAAKKWRPFGGDKKASLTNNNKPVDGLGRLSAELLKLVDHWRTLIDEFESSVPATFTLLPMLPKYGIEASKVPKKLALEFKAVKQAIADLPTTTDAESVQLNKLIDGIMEALTLEVYEQKVDQLDALLLRLAIHGDRGRKFVEQARKAHGQHKSFVAIEEFVQKNGKKASQWLAWN